jgi:predicted transporter
MNTIKPCPFCGVTVVVSCELTISHPTEDHIFIEHPTGNCLISGISSVLKVWNRRAE